MIDESALIHCEHISDRSFNDVVADFEKSVGVIDAEAFSNVVSDASDAGTFEKGVKAFEGSSGFMRFLDIDHGAWMTKIGLPAQAKLYILGNPLIARTMLKYDLGVGLNVPVRAMIYVDGFGKTRLAYDLPSSLMARLKNQEVIAAARLLDEKLAKLATSVTGVAA